MRAKRSNLTIRTVIASNSEAIFQSTPGQMQRGGCVYILTNKNNRVLYTGVTSDLVARIQQHLNKEYPSSFTAKYNVNKLVYFKSYSTIEEAIKEEKRIKGGSRKKKIALIESINRDWTDLWVHEVSKW